jgi:hypothetical protein
LCRVSRFATSSASPRSRMIHAMRAQRAAALGLGIAIGLVVAAVQATSAGAQENWNPLRTGSQPAAQRPALGLRDDTLQRPGEVGSDGERLPGQPPLAPRGGAVERSELAPVMAPDTSGLPPQLWRGIDLTAFEALLAGLDLPPRSPVLHQLWRRLLLSSAPAPAGAPSPDHFLALRLEALYRSGLLTDMNEVIGDRRAAGPLIEALAARKDIGLGERDAGCRAIERLAAPSAALPGRLKGETQLLSGYCAAARGDVHTAEIAATLAREEGVEAELPFAVLAGFAAGTQPRLALPSRVLLLDYRFLELLGPVNAAQIVDKAEPALLAVLSQDAKVEPRVQLAAAEAALRLNMLQPQGVADVLRRRAVTEGDAGNDPVLRRAMLLRAIEVSRSLDQQMRMASLLLGDAVRAGTRVQTAHMLAPVLQTLPPSPAAGSFAEMAVEIALAAGQFETARQWAQTADTTRHWLGLIDVADPARRGGRIASLALMQDLAVRGRLGAQTLHRLATVLDALDIDVPLALWDAANRTPQPASGYLPETGILADLAQSAQRRDPGRTILLVLRTIGPTGPEGAHILAAGDAVRALRRLGLEAEARRLALETLLPAWPHTVGN